MELAPHEIQVNAILPGWFPTAMTGDLPDTALGEQIRRKTSAGRWGEPADLIGAAVFLASRASNSSPALSLRWTAATWSPTDSATCD